MKPHKDVYKLRKLFFIVGDEIKWNTGSRQIKAGVDGRYGVDR